ncbi:MAG: hypothetical protein M3010_01190, partial [Candidatus Dormibacteraeota bacterium]|nr:hypothetical protein [Candidatus Dormibacteraeota bacterium]
MPTTADLHSLVNADRIRASVRRLFTGEPDEILGELFQNSQRARATQVTITTQPDGWTYADNGHGLVDGLAGFHTLLRLAESDFDNPTLAAQDPMGLGIHSLLAHAQVQAVTFASHSLQLTLDTVRWWSDPAYYSTWYERIESLPVPVAGLLIHVTCAPEWIKTIPLALNPRHQQGHASPAQGYADLLTITLDGQPVDTRLPAWVQPRTVLVETTYLGCPLTIGISIAPQPPTWEDRHHSAVNWYGQLIPTSLLSPFHYYLDVRAGRPVNPQAPTRNGLIADAAQTALHTFVREALFAYLTDPAHWAQVRAAPTWVTAGYQLDQARADREFAFFTASPLRTLADVGSFEDLITRPSAQVFPYTAPPTVLQDGVQIVTPPQDATIATAWYDYGLPSFAPLLGAVYLLEAGNPARLPIQTLWWQPGPPRPDAWNDPGVWGLSPLTDVPPPTWQPVAGTVCAFPTPAHW